MRYISQNSKSQAFVDVDSGVIPMTGISFVSWSLAQTCNHQVAISTPETVAMEEFQESRLEMGEVENWGWHALVDLKVSKRWHIRSRHPPRGVRKER